MLAVATATIRLVIYAPATSFSGSEHSKECWSLLRSSIWIRGYCPYAWGPMVPINETRCGGMRMRWCGAAKDPLGWWSARRTQPTGKSLVATQMTQRPSRYSSARRAGTMFGDEGDETSLNYWNGPSVLLLLNYLQCRHILLSRHINLICIKEFLEGILW